MFVLWRSDPERVKLGTELALNSLVQGREEGTYVAGFFLTCIGKRAVTALEL